jgi:hypothetical protein
MSLENKVIEFVFDFAWWNVYDSVEGSTRDSINSDSIYYFINNSVRVSVYNSIYDSIFDSISNKISDYEFKKRNQ